MATAIAFLVTTVAISIFAPTLTLAQTPAISCVRGESRTITRTNALTRQQEQVSACVDDQGRVFDALGSQITSIVIDAQGNQRTPERKPVDCSSGWRSYIHPVCLVRTGFSWIGAGLIWIGVKIATVAGGIFEAAIKYTIVEFGTYLQYIKPSIDAGWTALRDIANIVIIGLFVFIAINIILGVKEFGEKKAVAKVLVVAVLINFSLLFTKIIVDTSNFTAYQFYNSMVKRKGTSINQTFGSGESAVTLEGSGISGSFMQFLGVEGFADSHNKLSKIAENNQNALYALGYGILSLIFLIAVAIVFLYGAFLIISRAVLIVFLMLTSALAFASWLIPQQYVGSGFRKWWESLLKTAFFAPILVAFLWMTLRVSDELTNALVTNGPGAKGTLGALAEKASDPANAVALLNFILILGLLYASLITANTFAKGISGFRFAQAGVGGAIFGSLAGASRLGGILGRNTLGWGGSAVFGRLRQWYHRPNEIDESGRITRSREGRRTGVFGYLNRGILRGANYLATSRFDALQAKPVAAAVGGIGGTIAKSIMDRTKGMTKDNFRTMMEKKAQAADTLARAIGPTDRQREAIEQQAQRQINAQQQTVNQVREAVRAEVRGGQTQRPEVEARVEAHDEMVRRVENERISTRNRQESEMRMEQERISRALRDAEHQGATDAELDRIRQPLRELQAVHERELNAIDERTRQHQEDLRIAREEVQALNREAETAAARDRRVTREERILREMGTAAQRAHAQEVRLREQLLWDKRARPFIAGEMRGQQRRRDLRIIAEEASRAHPAAPPPPIP